MCSKNGSPTCQRTIACDLGTRFRSPDDRQHVAAFWELYLHELFTRLGFAVRLHPTLPIETTNPDMLVERDGDSFYVEAVALTDKDVERQSTRRRGQVDDGINERVQSANTEPMAGLS